MKKTFKFYLIVWAMAFAVFNLMAFLPLAWVGTERLTDSFWVGYATIMISLFGQLVCAFIALTESNLKKQFYNLSLLMTSYSGLGATFSIGAVCMINTLLPFWVCIIVCATVLIFNIVAVIKAAAVVAVVSSIDEKVKVQTFFIKSLTVDAEGLMARAKTEEIRAVCKKVYEAVRYSDPMSNEMLASAESAITIRFAAFSGAVAENNTDAAKEAAEELLILISDRNRKCKLLK